VSAAVCGASVPHATPSPYELRQIVRTDATPGDTSGSPDDSIPTDGLSRTETLDELGQVFGDQLQQAAGPFDSLEIDKLITPFEAVVPAPPSATGKSYLMDSTLPLEARDDSGSRSPVDLSLQSSDQGLEPANPLVDVNIPDRLGDGLSLPQIGTTIHPEDVPDQRAPSTVGDTAVYPNVSSNTDLVVAPTPTGMETLTQLRTPDSPTETTFDIDLPSGAHLQPAPRGGVEAVADGRTLFTVAPPTATDAAGQSVPVKLESTANTVTVTATPQNDVAYPILVDPNFDVYNWFQYVNTDALGWSSYTTPSWGANGILNSFNTPSYRCYPFLCGLYADAAAYNWNFAGAQSTWNYSVPRYNQDFNDPNIGAHPTSWIQQFVIGSWGIWGNGDRQISPSLLGGLWDPNLGYWAQSSSMPGGTAVGVWGPDAAGAYVFDTGAAHGAKTATFGLYNISSTFINAYRYAYMGYSAIYLGDASSPGFGALYGPTDASGQNNLWVDNRPAPIHVRASDNGLGVYEIDLGRAHLTSSLAPQDLRGSFTTTRTMNGSRQCDGNNANPCPYSVVTPSTPGSTALTYDPSQLQQGLNDVAVTAMDPMGNTVAGKAQLRVDHTPPTVAFNGGTLPSASSGPMRPRYSLQVDTADGTDSSPQSGVASLTISVDGHDAETLTPGCTSPSPNPQNCQIHDLWYFDASRWGSGPHTVTAVAKDAVGETSAPATLQVNIPADTTNPQLNVSGPLTQAPSGWVDQPAAPSITASASDGESGVTQIKLSVDGVPVPQQSQQQQCLDGGCTMSASPAVATAGLAGGAHTATVVAIDGSGNQTSRDVAFNVNPDGNNVSSSEVTRTLRAFDSTSSGSVVAPVTDAVPALEITDGNNPGLSSTANGWQSTGTDVPSNVSSNTGGGFAIQAPTGTIQVTPTTGSSSGTVASGVADVAGNTSNQSDTVVRPIFDGVTTFAAIRDATSPETYSWTVDLGPGQTLAATDAGAAVYNSDGSTVMGIAAQPAHDATGAEVPATLTVSGHTLTLTVQHREGTVNGNPVVYPVVGGPGWETSYTESTSASDAGDGSDDGMLFVSAPQPESPQAAGLTDPQDIAAYRGRVRTRSFYYVACYHEPHVIPDLPPGGALRPDHPQWDETCGNPFNNDPGGNRVALNYAIKGSFHIVYNKWIKHLGGGFDNIACDKILQDRSGAYELPPDRHCAWDSLNSQGNGGDFVRQGYHLTPDGRWTWQTRVCSFDGCDAGHGDWLQKPRTLAFYLWASGHEGIHTSGCIDCY